MNHFYCRHILEKLNQDVGASVGEFGTDLRAFAESIDEDQATTLPHAIQFLNCPQKSISICNKDDNRYRSECWIDRDDVKPGRTQGAFVGGRASWHPGFRVHQLQGRRIAYALLEATQIALQIWKDKTEQRNIPLDGSVWHMSQYYDTIKSKLKKTNDGPCEEKFNFMKRLCKVALHGRTEYTPRANPDQTSIRSLMLPASDGYLPYVEKEVLYDAPDVDISSIYPPAGSLDVRVVASLGRSSTAYRQLSDDQISTKGLMKHNRSIAARKLPLSTIKPGQGPYLHDYNSGYCDGSSNSWCDRDKESPCLLSGHNDRRGGIMFDPFSGWIVMKISDVKYGIVIVKLDLMIINNKRTEKWMKVNNGKRSLRSLLYPESVSQNGSEIFHHRLLQRLPPDMGTFLHPDCVLEYAIDGNVTSLDKDAILQKKIDLQRAVAIYPLLDEEHYEGSEELEIALRITGCEERRGGTYRLTHVYWA